MANDVALTITIKLGEPGSTQSVDERHYAEFAQRLAQLCFSDEKIASVLARGRHDPALVSIQVRGYEPPFLEASACPGRGGQPLFLVTQRGVGELSDALTLGDFVRRKTTG